MRFAIAAALLCCAAGAARARPPEDPKIAEARLHYESGLARFNLKEYKPAIEEFEAAYRLKPDPVFLYNLGQAYRLADDPEQALHFYRAYLRERPAAANRHDVEERVTQLEGVIAAKRSAAHPPDHTLAPETPLPTAAPAAAATATTTAPTAASEPAPDERAGRTKRIAAMATAGVGLAAIGVGIGMSALAKQASDKLTHGTQDAMYDLALDRQGRSDQNAAIALYAVGGAAVAVGVVLYVLGWRDAHRPRAVASVPSLGLQAGGTHALLRF